MVKVMVGAGTDAAARRLEDGLVRASNGAVAVVGSAAADSRTTIDLARRSRADVVLLDLSSDEPASSARALETIRALPGVVPAARILVLAERAEADAAVNALTAGAHGVLVMPADPAELVAPVLAAACGHSVVHGQLLSVLVGSAVRRDTDVLAGFNDQHIELWRMVADGLDTTQIAERLYVSERTAKRMVAFLLRRLRVANRIQAAALAGQVGLLDDVPAKVWNV